MPVAGKLLLVALLGAAGLAVPASAAEPPPVPTVTGVSPGKAAWNARSEITVTGTGFQSEVKIALVSVSPAIVERPLATDVTVESDTQLRFTLDPATRYTSEVPGDYYVRVNSSSGRSKKTAQAVLRLTNIVSGTAWNSIVGPVPANARPGTFRFAQLDEVGCSDPTHCVATGSYQTKNIHDAELLASLTNGSWTIAPHLLPDDAASNTYHLGKVSCGSQGHCAVLGRYHQEGATKERPFVERLADGTWHADPLPSPTGQPATDPPTVQSMSCSGTACVAVGYSAGRPIASTLDGGSWHTDFLPLPAGAAGIGHLRSVSCPTSSSCVAVGQYKTAAGHAGSLVETLSDGAWTAGKLPLPGNAAKDQHYLDTPRRVSCGSRVFCAAFGRYVRSEGGTRGMLLVLHGGSWTATTAPIPDAQEAIDPNWFGRDISGVSCAPTQTCVVIESGDREVTPPATETYADGHWSAALVRLPGDRRDQRYAQALGVTCYAAESCKVTGYYERLPVAGFVHQSYVATLDGTWSSAATPTPGETDIASALYDIWCSSQSRCVAVGEVGAEIVADYSDPMISTLSATG